MSRSCFLACEIPDPESKWHNKPKALRLGRLKSKSKNTFLEFGKGTYLTKGADLTIITWGAIVQKSIEATKKLNISADIIDIRTLYPLDLDIIKESIKKTNRVIIAHEDNFTSGFGGEISALISENFFEMLDAPIIRVASKNFPVAYSSILEDKILLQTDWIEDAIKRIISF